MSLITYREYILKYFGYTDYVNTSLKFACVFKLF